MKNELASLERLLTTLDISLHAFVVCNVAVDARFGVRADEHDRYSLRAEGRRLSGGAGMRTCAVWPRPHARRACGAGPSASRQADTLNDVPAAEHCAMLMDGLVEFDAADGADGAIMTICSTLSATYGGSFGLFDALTSPLTRDVSAIAAISTAFRLLLDERSRPDTGTNALTEALMKQCLVLFVREELRDKTAPSVLLGGLNDARLRTVVTEILREPAAPRSVEELARVAGMSRSGFATAFHQQFDQSPMDFVQKARLHHASKLLVATDLPIKVVAGSMGFSSRSHFSRALKAAYGVDPTTFRHRRQNHDEDAPRRSGRGWIERLTSDDIGGVED